ncbi:(Fe-S)-binding protein [Candidatus Pyrohabitans sp.]
MELRESLKRCMRCGFCRASCPVFKETKNEGSVARGKLQTLLALQEGEIPASEKALLRLFECTTCDACSAACPAGVSVASLIEEARRRYLGKLELPVHEWKVEITREMGNPFGEVMRASKGEASTAYFPGCTTQFRAKEIEEAAIKLLGLIFDDFAVIRDFCCGAPLLTFGSAWEEFIAQNRRRLRERGVERLIVTCPGCHNTFAEHYPEVEVVHLSRLLRENMEKLTLSPLSASVAYHDPCHLARGAGIYREPRLLLRAIPQLELRELAHSKLETRCCGAGGGFPLAFPELSALLGKRRLEEVRAANADILATACPTCYIHLRNLAREDLKVEEVTVLLVEQEAEL